MTDLGALSMESGLWAATAQLENRQRRFALRLLSLLQGDQAREAVSAPAAIGRRLTYALAYAGKTESTVLLEEPETLGAELLQEEEDEAKAEAEKDRPGLTTVHRHVAARQRCDRALGGMEGGPILGCMGYNQEAYDAECAALARALESASQRPTTPEQVTIFTDAQAAIRRMASGNLAPASSTRFRRGSTSPR